MSMFIVELNGRGIAALCGMDRLEAEDFMEGDVFQSDLLVLTHQGKPLWDGEAALTLRMPSLKEQATVAEMDRNLPPTEADSEGYVWYLVPVDDPTDEDYDDCFEVDLPDLKPT